MWSVARTPQVEGYPHTYWYVQVLRIDYVFPTGNPGGYPLGCTPPLTTKFKKNFKKIKNFQKKFKKIKKFFQTT